MQSVLPSSLNNSHVHRFMFFFQCRSTHSNWLPVERLKAFRPKKVQTPVRWHYYAAPCIRRSLELDMLENLRGSAVTNGCYDTRVNIQKQMGMG